MQFFIGFLLLCGIAAILVWVSQQGGSDDAESTVERTISADEQELDNLRLEEVLIELSRLSSGFDSSEEPFLKLDHMRSRLRKLDKIEDEHQLSESQQEKVSEIRINANTFIVIESLENGFDCEETKRNLKSRCSQLIASGNEQIALRAKYAIVLVDFMEFQMVPDETSFNKFKTSIETNADAFLYSTDNTLALTSILYRYCRKNKAGKFNERIYDSVSSVLNRSPIDEIRKRGELISQSSMYVSYDLGTLPRRIATGNPFAPDDLKGAMDKLAGNPEASPEIYLALIRSYESFFSTDKIELAGTNWQSMYRMVAALPESTKKELLNASLARQRSRAGMIGQPFDISGSDAKTNLPLRLASDKYTVILFVDREPDSIKLMSDFAKSLKSMPQNLQTVVAFAAEMTKLDVDSLANVPDSILIASTESTQRYLKDFEVDFFPYTVLLDRDGNMAFINIQVSQVNNRIAALEARRRDAAK